MAGLEDYQQSIFVTDFVGFCTSVKFETLSIFSVNVMAQHVSDDVGRRQSPVNIDLAHCRYDASLRPVNFDHDPSDCVDVTNKGTTWSVRVNSDAKTKLTGAHLPGTYRLAEVHAHWGERSGDGSEHRIGGHGHAAEVHLVHYNEKYGTVDAAKGHGDGLAVLGIFSDEGNWDNHAFVPLIEALKRVPFKGQTTQLANGLDLFKIMPSSREFCTYLGSLTTPPYTECVVWTVFVNPVSVSHAQLDVFRSLRRHEHHETKDQHVKITNNVRPCQELGDREIRTSFQPSQHHHA